MEANKDADRQAALDGLKAAKAYRRQLQTRMSEVAAAAKLAAFTRECVREELTRANLAVRDAEQVVWVASNRGKR